MVKNGEGIQRSLATITGVVLEELTAWIKGAEKTGITLLVEGSVDEYKERAAKLREFQQKLIETVSTRFRERGC